LFIVCVFVDGIKVNQATAAVGTVAYLAVYILQIPSLGTADIGNALEKIFYVFLPNFCFSKALEDMYTNYEYGKLCKEIDAVVNRTTFCQYLINNNGTSFCCSGEKH